MLYLALSPICTADKVGLIICCGCYWGCLVWGNNILARLVNSVSLQFFHPPAFCLCLSLSLLKLPDSLISLSAFSLLSFKVCCCVSHCGSRRYASCSSSFDLATFLFITHHCCGYNKTVVLRAYSCVAYCTLNTLVKRVLKLFTWLNSTFGWLTNGTPMF